MTASVAATGRTASPLPVEQHAGATLAELMARLGHSTAKAALVYQHVAEGRDRIIADRMALLAQPAVPGVDGD